MECKPWWERATEERRKACHLQASIARGRAALVKSFPLLTVALLHGHDMRRRHCELNEAQTGSHAAGNHLQGAAYVQKKNLSLSWVPYLRYFRDHARGGRHEQPFI